MAGLKYFKDEMIMEVGRIAMLRAGLRASLLLEIDALLSTSLHDQGFGRLLASDKELGGLCQALLTIVQVRGVSQDAVQRLVQIQSDYSADFEMAAAIANGMWTNLGGGDSNPMYGVFLKETAVKECFRPEWKKMTLGDLCQLRVRLEEALQSLQPIGSAVLVAKARE